MLEDLTYFGELLEGAENCKDFEESNFFFMRGPILSNCFCLHNKVYTPSIYPTLYIIVTKMCHLSLIM